MLSRVADRCYWLARYLERAENSSRLIKVYSSLLLDLPASTQLGWDVVLRIKGCEEEFRAKNENGGERQMLGFLLNESGNPVALLSSLEFARENARTARDVLPTEAWRAVNELCLFARERLPKASQARQRDQILSTLIEQIQGITGMLAGTMSHGPATQFMRLGRNLERADMTTRMIDVAVAILLADRSELARFDNTLWMAILRTLSGYQMYRQYVRRRVQSDEVIRFLLQDEAFPRSVRHCIDQAAGALDKLPRSAKPLSRAHKLRERISSLQLASLDNQALHGLMDELQLDIAEVGNAIRQTWLMPDSIDQ
jgi:uncharacterized alpha-E superfamily protein